LSKILSALNNKGQQLLPGCLTPLVVIVEAFERVQLTEDVVRFMALVFDVVKNVLDNVFGEILPIVQLWYVLIIEI